MCNIDFELKAQGITKGELERQTYIHRHIYRERGTEKHTQIFRRRKYRDIWI